MLIVLMAAAAAAIACASGQATTISRAEITTTPTSIRFMFREPQQASLIGLHYSINQAVVGVAAGQYNYDITTKTDGAWVHENGNVQLKSGDKIHYWVLAVVNGAGYQQLNLEHTASFGSTASTAAPTTKATTPKPTTQSTMPTTPTTKAPITDAAGNVCQCENAASKKRKAKKSQTKRAFKQSSSKCTSYPCLILEDNFDTFDFDLWKHEITAGGGGNWEFQYYTNNRTNSYVKDGYLHITPTLTSDKYGEQFLTSGVLDIWGNGPSHCTGNAFYGCFRQGTPSNPINPLQSARLRTWETFSVKYGKVEVEAKMPAGDWIWPAIWLLPKNEEYGGWPASGEIDIVEARGNADLRDAGGKSVGVDSAGATLHWGPYWPVNGWDKTHATKRAESGTFASDFHKYAVEWDEDRISFFLDDEEILNVNPERDGHDGFWNLGEFDTKVPGSSNPWAGASKLTPFDKEYYIILNVAVGGTNGFFGDDWVNGNGAKPWRNTSPTAFAEFWNGRSQWMPTWKQGETAMVVNYVRVWKMKPNDE